MAIHVKSFKIQSYRGIQNLALENLNSINVCILQPQSVTKCKAKM